MLSHGGILGRRTWSTLKEEYARMLQFAYRNRSSYDRMSYLFAASSFQQAYKRSAATSDQIAEQRTRQAKHSSKRPGWRSRQRLNGLKEQRAEKSRIMAQEQAEKAAARRRPQRPAERPQHLKQGGRTPARDPKASKQNQRNDLDAAIRKAIEEASSPRPNPAKGARHPPAPASWTSPSPLR
jgi:hypothetical protein